MKFQSLYSFAAVCMLAALAPCNGAETATPPPATAKVKATPEPGSEFTGEQPAVLPKAEEAKPGPMMPEAFAEPPASLAIPVITRVIYVAPTSDKKAKGLTPETPVSPQRAAYLSLPGDVILFAEGEYEAPNGKTPLTIERSGEPGKPIIYAPAPGAKVTLHNNGAWEAIKIAGASYIEIRNFRVIGNAKNVTMEEAMREMSNLKNPRTCGNGIGIDLKSQTKSNPHHITVRDCVVSDCSGGGIFANHVDYLTFENNVVYRCGFWSPYANSGISVYQPTACDESTDYKIIVRNNISFGNYENVPFFHSNRKDPSKRKFTDGNGIILDDFMNSQAFGGGGGKPYGGRSLVANNVVFANGGSGIHSFKSNNVDVVHNLAYDNNKHPFLKDGQIFGNNARNMRILNNIMVAPPGKPVTSINKNEGLVQDHNVYACLDGSVPKFAGEQASNILASPGLELKDWILGKRGFTVTSDSPLRAAGLAIPDIGADYFGKTRSKDKPDIGPFVLETNLPAKP
ncbi:MAG: hypothetical protein ABI600_03960 [Luteolibacter sp.]